MWHVKHEGVNRNASHKYAITQNALYKHAEIITPLVVTLPQAAARLWWTCVPTIKACFTDSGVMELFWEPPSVEARPIIRGYQVCLISAVAIVEVVR